MYHSERLQQLIVEALNTSAPCAGAGLSQEARDELRLVNP